MQFIIPGGIIAEIAVVPAKIPVPCHYIGDVMPFLGLCEVSLCGHPVRIDLFNGFMQ